MNCLFMQPFIVYRFLFVVIVVVVVVVVVVSFFLFWILENTFICAEGKDSREVMQENI